LDWILEDAEMKSKFLVLRSSVLWGKLSHQKALCCVIYDFGRSKDRTLWDIVGE
jgi:hypothetical protein